MDGHDVVVPVFCFDPRLLRGRHGSGPRTQFLLECLADLREALRRRGSDLVLTNGRPEQALPKLARELNAQAILWTDDVGPFAAARDAAVRHRLERAGVEVRTTPGLFAVDDPGAVLSSADAPYRVFTPFHRAWQAHGRRRILPAPRTMPALPAGLRRMKLPTLGDLGLGQRVADPAPGGEGAGRRAMSRFLTGHLAGYDQARGLAGAGDSSRLSPYLHFGCISARELEDRAGSGPGAEAFRRQLCWRDFYAHVLLHHPDSAVAELQERYRGSLEWSADRGRLAAWQEGRTGFPLVDAGMRELAETGWIHNRVRMVAASFLVKHLHLDWRVGEAWFAERLVDYDPAQNEGNWQWVAGTGIDAQPWFRIFNPERQRERFDPDGAYVERWRGRGYPEPILDLAAEAAEAKERFRAAATL